MAFLCGKVEAQTSGFTGTWYIANHSGYNASTHSSNWYLVPAKNPTQTPPIDVFYDAYDSPLPETFSKPFLTTYKTFSGSYDNNSVWEFQAVEGESGYYYIKHALTGKYVVYGTVLTGNNARRKYVHLEETDTPDETAKFGIITYSASGVEGVNIYPKSQSTLYWNPAGGNKAYYSGQGSSDYYGGLIGGYIYANDPGSIWHLEPALPAPAVTYSYETGKVTMTDLVAGVSIYYTTDGSTTPTSSSTLYSGPFTQSTTATIKAIAIQGTNSSDVTTFELKKVATPKFSDNGFYEIIITCDDRDASFYYTTDGTTPTLSSTFYEGPLDYSYSNQTIKAIAVKDNMIISEVKTGSVKLKCKPPVITIDEGTGIVSITCEDTDGVTFYYTTDGTTDPTASSEYEYRGPFSLTSTTTVKAVAVKAGGNYDNSIVVEKHFSKLPAPTFGIVSNYITISGQEGASIYYTLNGSNPSTSSNLYTVPLQEGVSGVDIKAIAVKEDCIPSSVSNSGTDLKLQCDQPVIKRVSNTNAFSIERGSFPSGIGEIHYTYTTDGSEPADPTTASSTYSSPVSFSAFPVRIKAIVTDANYSTSEVRSKTIISDGLPGNGTEDDPYLIASDADFVKFVTMASDTDFAGEHFKLTANVSAAGTSKITTPFSGVLEGSADANGNFYTISGLTHPIFSTIDGGTVCNIILTDVSISGHEGNTGAIACLQKGTSIVYNCGILSGSVSGTGATGSLVGELQYTTSPYEFTRVVNCFSFAEVASTGSYAAGIVGNNTYASTTANFGHSNYNFKTAVTNCMFYGDITGGTQKYPIYGGYKIINTTSNGVNNYNYFLSTAEFTSELTNLASYNGALPAAEEDLTDIEFYRSILNCNRDLCASYLTQMVYSEPATQAAREKIAKWVLDPAIAPYPILKQWGKYPSVINFDPDKVLEVQDDDSELWIDRENAELWQGQKLGELSVNVKAGKHPTLSVYGLASTQYAEKTLTLNVVDMDTLHGDFCYAKVQLPYYNEVFGNPDGANHYAKYCANYTDSIVTGWKITYVDYDYPYSYSGYEFDDFVWGYNFASRDYTDVSMYATSGRVFAQGGYYYVPTDVTEITIEAYWGRAVYLANKDYAVDLVNFSGGNGTTSLPFGSVPNTFNGYSIYDNIQTAIGALDFYEANYDMNDYHIPEKTVYDQAIVLVGNYQFKMFNAHDYIWGPAGSDDLRPFTITSLDLDFDNEPDHCLQLQFSVGTTRTEIQPVRFDFLPVVPLGMALRWDDIPMTIGHFLPRGHFEITETAFIEMTELEYDARAKRAGHFKEEAPLILNGGRLDKILTCEHDCPDRINIEGTNYPISQRTRYMILGGRLRMETFAPGTHPNSQNITRHCPVSVMGGKFNKFYLSGMTPVEPSYASVGTRNCYIDGGRFEEIAGAGQDQIVGDVWITVNHSSIRDFYGGGINAAKPITGSIAVYMYNSIVNQYCGGPKFGDMIGDYKSYVSTEAENTRFGKFYGGGYGGTSFHREILLDYSGAAGTPENIIVPWDQGTGSYPGFDGYTPEQYVNGIGYQAQYEYEFWNTPAGADKTVVARLYRLDAEFSYTVTGYVMATLTDCEVMHDCYGGGCYGGVDDYATLSLHSTTVHGSVYGGSFSDERPSFKIYDKEVLNYPSRDATGVCSPGTYHEKSKTYYWTNDHGSTSNPVVDIDETSAWFYTTVPMDNLGLVNGYTTVFLDDDCVIYGDVYGGGNRCGVSLYSGVQDLGAAEIHGNVYGGCNLAKTGGDAYVYLDYSTVGVDGNTSGGSVFGGGRGSLDNNEAGQVGGDTDVRINEDTHVYNNVYGGGEYASVLGDAVVTISGGEIGPLDMTGLNAYVYGGSKGVTSDPSGTYKNFANVSNTFVTVEGGEIKGSIFGGAQDGHVLGNCTVNLSGDAVVGTNGTTSWDGNIFGGGRNYLHSNTTAGRVGGNITVNMSGGTLKGNIYGGGRLANTGVDIDGNMQTDETGEDPTTYGHIIVNVTGGTVGHNYEHIFDNYEPARYIDTIGNVYGGAKGITFEVDRSGATPDTTYFDGESGRPYWKDYAKSKTCQVNIGGDAYIWGNVYGGSEQAHVRDSAVVTIGGSATVHQRAYAGGRGFLCGAKPAFKHSGDVGEEANGSTPRHGLSRITLKDNAKVQVCLYGGAKIASVHGNAYVTLQGGQVGRKRTLTEIHDQPTHCYVFGSSQGTNQNGNFNTWSNVDTAYVTIKPGTRVFGSVFGGGEDGHVLGDVHLDIELGENDSIGTHGYSRVDGNIFSGGRGYNPKALTVGGVRGNIYTYIHGGRGYILGDVFGGGRIASTGINLTSGLVTGEPAPGSMIEDIPDNPETPDVNEAQTFGHTHVLIEGDVIIGHDYVSATESEDGEEYLIGEYGGNVYGGAMGEDADPEDPDPTHILGKMSHVKQTEVIVRGNAWVKGTVNGGGEDGDVWQNAKVIIDGNCTIGVDRVGEGHLPLEKLIYSGNVFGGSWGSDSKSYVNLGRIYGNDTVIIHGGHIRNNIYGGGEYASVGSFDEEDGTPVAGTGHCVVIMDGGELGPLDMSGINAYVFGGGKGEGNDADNQYKDFGQVFSAHVQIKNGARVYGSIFGGGEDGHVTDTVRVSVTGGTIGTTGLTTWDGNIFGGGRNYLATNFAAGRVGGNIHVDVEGGSMYGSVYGGGRLASVGVDENGVAFTDNPEDHGHTFVTIKGGTIGFVPESGHCEMDSIRGNVYGGCKGIVNKPQENSVDVNLLSNVTTTHVVIQDGAIIKGSVFGGGEDGHVLSNTNVTVEGGQIGDDESVCANKQHGNVYGGGRGLGKNAAGLFVETAGTVNGNSLVTVTGGDIKGNVYGGGQLASVGMRDGDTPNPNTGWARVKISGGTIGTAENLDNERGNVFGSSRGVAGDTYKDFAFVNNTLVTLSSGSEVVKGNVFGSGDDGHVMLNTQVTINGGQVGSEGVSNSNKGCVYGGGRGLNLDATGNLSPTAGLVKGDSKVSIQSGVVYGDVFGGGNASAVTGHKLVDVLKPATGGAAEIHGNVYGGCKTVPSAFANLNLGLKTVNVRGGHIKGSVFGCSYKAVDGNATSITSANPQWTSFVNIDGGIIDGDVYGAGWSGEVKGSVGINIGANAIAYDDPDDDPDAGWQPRTAANVKYDDNGGLPIVVFGNVRDINVDARSLTFTGFLVDEGAPKPGARYKGFCWSTSEHPTIESDTVRKSFVVGDVGNFSISVPSGIAPGTYYVRAFATNPTGTSYSPEMTFVMAEGGTAVLAIEQPEPERVIYTPTANKLHIKGSVYGGSNQFGDDTQNNHWNDPDISGYSVMFIDGEGYDTELDEDANAAAIAGDESHPHYMNIGDGIFGSGTHCESGKLGREVIIRNYGKRNSGDEFTTATRSLTTIQRGGVVLLDNTQLNLTGKHDISNIANKNYGILKIDLSLFVANGSGIVLGATDAPAYMDSIKQIKSLYLKDGLISYNQIGAGNSGNWEVVGIKDNDNKLYRLVLNTEDPENPVIEPDDLNASEENVIVFNGDSRLWVRYHDNTGAQKYGELQGFFRMKSPFKPYGTESFAYARPKLTEANGGITTGDPVNAIDGGFLSYVTTNNFFNDDGNDGGIYYNACKQYPYTNVMEMSKGDMTDYREWVIVRNMGKSWYVDGTRNWGRDLSKTDGWGLSPDKPKKTLFGTADDKGVVSETLTGTNSKLNFSYKNDIIYVVGALSASAEGSETVWCDSVAAGVHYPLKLYRYPGGHALSNSTTSNTYLDYGTGSDPTSANTNTGVTGTSNDGPGPNYGAMLQVESDKDLTLQGVMMDGLSYYNSAERSFHKIPYDLPDPAENYVATTVSKPLIVTEGSSNLTLKGGTELKRGYNNTDADDTWFHDADYSCYTTTQVGDNETVVTVAPQGGALFVDKDATVNVEGLVTITDNQQNNGGTPVTSNVYLPTFAKYLNITNALTSGAQIGITSPIRNNAANYKYNTFSPVAVGVRTGTDEAGHRYDSIDARNAWTNNNFYDDLDWFFYKIGSDHVQKHSYYSSTIPDYPDNTGYNPDNTVFFGWTWANVVRTQPSTYSISEPVDGRTTVTISPNLTPTDPTKEGLPWLISQVNGLNGETASNLSTYDIKLTTDVDLQQYVWVPVGALESDAASFAGTFDGQGHLIKNLSIDYTGSEDGQYNYMSYGLFGSVVDGSIDRTFVVDGFIRPTGTANIGGLVGRLYDGGAISNSESAARIICLDLVGDEIAAGGLVGKMQGGTIHSSMAMPDITIDHYPTAGGLVGYTEAHSGNTPSVKNSFANAKFTFSNGGVNSFRGAGGLVGISKALVMNNCYSHLYANATNLPKYWLLVAYNESATLSNCFGMKGGLEEEITGGGTVVRDYDLCNPTATLSDCGKYTATASADTYGYMYADNKIEGDTALFVRLNANLGETALNGTSGHTYARWARPTLSEINGDLPVLLLCEFDRTTDYQGNFRSVGTYAGGPTLQYGGPIRDGIIMVDESDRPDEVDAALERIKASSDNDYLFIYGDVNTVGSGLSITQDKVAIHEDAAILNPGALAYSSASGATHYPNTYVGITFDNTSRNAEDYDGNRLFRDWHMLSTPLANAPLGVNYDGDVAQHDPYHNYDEHPLPPYNFYPANGENAHDGYFPSNTPYNKYDYFCWYEPDWQWINFKRNGNDHWHFDHDPTHDHPKISYKAKPSATANQNETTLVVGKGYMMSIDEDTYLQSHGELNDGNVEVELYYTTQGLWGNGEFYVRNNLIGNPYHAYLDFTKTGLNSYYVYDADGGDDPGEDPGEEPGEGGKGRGRTKGGYLIYPTNGSRGGYYAPQYLHPHQGFFITVNPKNNTNFNLNSETGNQYYTYTFKKTETEGLCKTRAQVDGDSGFRDWQPAYPLVNLFAYDEEERGDVLVVEFERPENGGGFKAHSLRNGKHSLYARFNGEDYGAFFAKQGTERVTVCFKTDAATPTVYTLNWNLQNGDFHTMRLIDNKMGVDYDMLAHDSYTFEASRYDYATRFYIVFSCTDVEEHEEETNNHFAFFDGSQWVVNGNGQLELVDMTGRVLETLHVAGDQSRVSFNRFASGVYLLRLCGNQSTKVQKIVLTK